jgi:hypothetical protein
VAFGDRRTVGGFDLPYLMTTTVGGSRTLEPGGIRRDLRESRS